jgi:vancomycin resistance protein YoaR
MFVAGAVGGLEVRERHNHSKPPDGTPLDMLGRDAHVAYTKLDLRMANPHLTALKLAIAIDDRDVTVTFLAAENPGFDIVLESRDVAPIMKPDVRLADLRLPRGERRTIDAGETGYVVQLVRHWRFADGSTRSDDLGECLYLPRAAIVATGAFS